MTTAATRSRSVQGEPEPAWDVALLFPFQGDWSDDEYLSLAGKTRRLVELIDGRLEVLPMVTLTHQRIAQYLFQQLNDFVRAHELGEVVFMGYPVRLRDRTFREPDIVFVQRAHARWLDNRFSASADLVVEVVSEGGRTRDLVEKRRDYAQAGVAEYWIVDPKDRAILVLTLKDGQYVEHGRFGEGQQASSVLLDGLRVEVSEVFAAASGA